MMREHLYRGKTESGEWVFGDLIHDCVDAFSKNIQVGIKPKGCYPIEVIAETVGQFTGLTDKNGTKIFEGDALEYSDRAFTQKSGIAMFSVSDGAFFVVADDGEELFINSQMQITGNIHDK